MPSCFRLHHNQIVNSTELLPALQELRAVLPTELGKLMDNVGFNMAALRLLQLHLEERDNVKLFRDVSLAPDKAKEQAKKKKKPGKVKDVAVVRTLTA
ncbi:Small-subunit processome [Aphelenchoides avenae]|nr:Small-subunit processome [Aphelenchus avenae]